MMVGWILFALFFGFSTGWFIGIGTIGYTLQKKYGKDWEERLKK